MIHSAKFLRNVSILGLCALSLSACSMFGGDKKTPLPGERISVLELQKTLEPGDVAVNASGFVAPDPWKNEYWPQAGGYPNHTMQNLALSPNALQKIWSEKIGEGSRKNLPLTAQPIVFENQIFTLDTNSNVSAFDLKTGKRLWRNTIRAKHEDEEVIGGGIAYSSNVVYATNGYNELLALNPKTGGIMWRSKLPSPSRSAPTILDNRVYVLTVDNRLVALSTTDGKQLWDYQGLTEAAGLVGGASPAASSEVVIAPMSSGDLIALRVENGSVAWGDNLAPTVKVGGLSALPDIKALPLLDKDLVVAISYGGKIVGIDVRTGTRIWQKDIGGASTPWIAGNQIFLISSNDELVAMSRDSGALVWVKSLSTYYKNKDGNNALLWKGPILAGGRLILTGPDGAVLEVDPSNGNLIRHMNASATIAVPPVVASGTLLLLGEDGSLSAYQ